MKLRDFPPILLLIASAIGGCDCGDAELGQYGDLQVVINSPSTGTVYGLDDTIDFKATLTDTIGVKDLSLLVGTTEVKDCPAGTTPTDLVCEDMITVASQSANLSSGKLTLTAEGHDNKGDTVKQSVTVTVTSLKVTFTAPPSSGSPPLATVSGTSNVTVAVESAAPLKSVVVTYDANKPLASWSSPSSGMMSFTQSVDWSSMLGFGGHVLDAKATDVNDNIGTATLRIQVACTDDSQCSSGQRCCMTDGSCNDAVGLGDNCDCDHPCTTENGCFPGTCGQMPQQCRPGCNPGNEQTPAQVCTGMQNGEPAFCTQSNTMEGGACAPGDDCDVVKQDCPDLPLNRAEPESPTNPLVPYTCTPAAPGDPPVNQCLPAGKTKAGGTNCDIACDNDTTNCVKGYLCTQPLGLSNQPCGPSSCTAQCSDPWMPTNPLDLTPPQSPDCPNGYYCAGLLGNGFVPYTTGSCTSMLGDPQCGGGGLDGGLF